MDAESIDGDVRAARSDIAYLIGYAAFTGVDRGDSAFVDRFTQLGFVEVNGDYLGSQRRCYLDRGEADAAAAIDDYPVTALDFAAVGDAVVRGHEAAAHGGSGLEADRFR